MRQSVSALLIGFLLISLSGCVSFNSFLNDDERNLAMQYDDAGIKTAITSALLKENATKANDVAVHSFRGHVFLVGEADREFRAFAFEAAQQVTGVVHVTTHWFASSTGDTEKDSALAASVAERTRQLREDPAILLSIDVWGGNVILTGIMPTQADIDKAVTLCRHTAGVASVTSYISRN